MGEGGEWQRAKENRGYSLAAAGVFAHDEPVIGLKLNLATDGGTRYGHFIHYPDTQQNSATGHLLGNKCSGCMPLHRQPGTYAVPTSAHRRSRNYQSQKCPQITVPFAASDLSERGDVLEFRFSQKQIAVHFDGTRPSPLRHKSYVLHIMHSDSMT